jgi:hypothetical protein
LCISFALNATSPTSIRQLTSMTLSSVSVSCLGIQLVRVRRSKSSRGGLIPGVFTPAAASAQRILPSTPSSFTNGKLKGAGAQYGENHIAFASDLWNNIKNTVSGGETGSSCGGRAESLYHAMARLTNKFVSSLTHEESRPKYK